MSNPNEIPSSLRIIPRKSVPQSTEPLRLEHPSTVHVQPCRNVPGQSVMTAEHEIPSQLAIRVPRKPVGQAAEMPCRGDASTRNKPQPRPVSEGKSVTAETANSSIRESSGSISTQSTEPPGLLNPWTNHAQQSSPVSNVSLVSPGQVIAESVIMGSNKSFSTASVIPIEFDSTFFRTCYNTGKMIGKTRQLLENKPVHTLGRKLTSRIPADAPPVKLMRQVSDSLKLKKQIFDLMRSRAAKAAKSALLYDEGEKRPHPGDGCEIVDLMADRAGHLLKGRPRAKRVNGRNRKVYSDLISEHHITETSAVEPFVSSSGDLPSSEGDRPHSFSYQQIDTEENAFTIRYRDKTTKVYPSDFPAFIQHMTAFRSPDTVLEVSTEIESSETQDDEAQLDANIDAVIDSYYGLETASMIFYRNGCQACEEEEPVPEVMEQVAESSSSSDNRSSGISNSVESVRTMQHACTSSTDGWVQVAGLTGGLTLSSDADELQVPQSNSTTFSRLTAARDTQLDVTTLSKLTAARDSRLQAPRPRLPFDRMSQGEPGEGFIAWRPHYRHPDNDYDFYAAGFPRTLRSSQIVEVDSCPPTPTEHLQARPLTVANGPPVSSVPSTPDPDGRAETAVQGAATNRHTAFEEYGWLPQAQEEPSLARRALKKSGKKMMKFLREWEEG